MEKMKQPRQFYDGGKMLRYNPLWCIVTGERSVGKSFYFKRRSINSENTITIYLRRTDELRKKPTNWKTYLSDLFKENVIDPDAEYKVSADGIWVNGIQKVMFSALSTDSTAHSTQYLPDDMNAVGKKQTELEIGKAISKKKRDELEDEKDYVVGAIENAEATFERVKPIDIKKEIVYEEILEPKGKYLKDEITLLLEYYVTVDRYSGTKLFGLSNLMSAYNPYFDYFGIRPFSQEFKWYKNKTLLVQNVKIPGMADFVESQRFYNLVKGTDYGEYLKNNTPWQDDHAFIEKRPPTSRMVYNVRLNGKVYGIWEQDGIYYISGKNDPTYAIFSGLKSMTKGDYPIIKNDGAYKLINNAIQYGIIRFDNIPIRESIYDMIQGGYREM